MKAVARTLRKERGDLELVEERIHQLVPGRPQFCRPVRPQRRQGLQEYRLLQDDDLAQTGKLKFSAQRQLACATH